MVVVCEKIPSDQEFIVALVNESRENINLPPLPENKTNRSDLTLISEVPDENDLSNDEAVESDDEQQTSAAKNAIPDESTNPIDDSLINILIPENIDVQDFLYQSQQRLQIMADYHLGQNDFIEQITPHYDLQLPQSDTSESISFYDRNVSRSISTAIISEITSDLPVKLLTSEILPAATDEKDMKIQNRKKSIQGSRKSNRSNFKQKKSDTAIASPLEPVLINSPTPTPTQRTFRLSSSSQNKKKPRVRSRYMNRKATSQSTETKLEDKPSETTLHIKNGLESLRNVHYPGKSNERNTSQISIINIQFGD